MTLVVATLMPSVVRGEEYGHVTGRFVYDGPRPAVRAVSSSAPTICVPGGVVRDESLVVGPKGGLANVFVYLPKAPAVIHPDLAKPPERPLRFEQQACVFHPHCMIARAGRAIEVKSLDPVAHSTHTFPIRNDADNFVLPAAPTPPRTVKLPKAESLPISVRCDFYPWMSAYWLVLDHPYAAVTAPDGTFTIRNLPTGRHEFRVWHERTGYLERTLVVRVEAGETTNLGDLTRRPAEFEGK